MYCILILTEEQVKATNNLWRCTKTSDNLIKANICVMPKVDPVVKFSLLCFDQTQLVTVGGSCLFAFVSLCDHNTNHVHKTQINKFLNWNWIKSKFKHFGNVYVWKSKSELCCSCTYT